MDFHHGFSQRIFPALLIPTFKMIMYNLFLFHYFILENTAFPSLSSERRSGLARYTIKIQHYAINCKKKEKKKAVKIAAGIPGAVDSLSKILICLARAVHRSEKNRVL